MDLVLFYPEEYQQQYNCSFYSVEKIPIAQRQDVMIGISFIVLFFVFEILYIPSLLIMRQKQFFAQSCYKLMYFMGISDLFCMSVNGFFTGYFAVKGYVFCSSPTLIYWLGIAGTSLWVYQSDCGMMLALNRCLEMINPKLNAFFFKGSKTFIWIGIAVTHTVLFAIFTKPVLFSGLYISWFFNPHVGYYDDYGSTYINIMHTIHNIMVVAVLSSCYIVFIIVLIKKSSLFSSASRQQHSQKESYAQVFIICFVNGFAATIYVYMQFFPVFPFIILFAQYAWFFAHAAPAVIYLSINKTIQRRIRRIIGQGDARVSAVTAKQNQTPSLVVNSGTTASIT